MQHCYRSMPEYFRTKSPEDLIDLRKVPYAYAYDSEGKTFYEVLTETPERLNMFNKAMMQMEAGSPTLGMFPFSSLKEEVIAEPERAFVVDIGGGRGQCLLMIQQETSNGFGASSKMILQDRPAVLDTIPQELVPGIEKMGYDFYTEQPVKSELPPKVLDGSRKLMCHRCTHLLYAPHYTQLPRRSLHHNPQEYRRSHGSQITPPDRRNHRSSTN